MDGVVSSGGCIVSFSVCIFIACGYVGSLYVWKNEKNERSAAPSVIKKRFVSVFVASSIAPFVVYLFVHPRLLEEHSFLAVLGIRWEGVVEAIIFPLVLTMVLFSGPLAVQYFTGMLSVYAVPSYWFEAMKELVFLRNYIVAPLTEEFVFRACILALITPCCSFLGSVLVCPLFFGAAHLHHAAEQIRIGVPPRRALFVTAFQFMYTSLFGAYSGYLFLRTGHLVAPVVAHAFCNHMGFPDFGAVLHFPQPKRALLMLIFVVGLISWIYLLTPLTNPSMYSNDLPWIQN